VDECKPLRVGCCGGAAVKGKGSLDADVEAGAGGVVASGAAERSAPPAAPNRGSLDSLDGVSALHGSAEHVSSPGTGIARQRQGGAG